MDILGKFQVPKSLGVDILLKLHVPSLMVWELRGGGVEDGVREWSRGY